MMTTVTAATRGTTPASPAAGQAAAPLGPAALVDLGAAASRQRAGLVGATAGARSLDAIVQDRTKALADRLGKAFADRGIPLDEPIGLTLDGLGNATTDSPYKTKIERLFVDDPDLAEEFEDVAGLNPRRAAQKALEAFEREKQAARDDDDRSAAYGRYTARLARSQDLSGTMTLDDGALRSASMAFMDASVGEVPAAKASARAEQAAAQRVSRSA